MGWQGLHFIIFSTIPFFSFHNLPSSMLHYYRHIFSSLLSSLIFSGSGITQSGRPEFDSGQGQEICLYSTASRPTESLTQFPIQWLLGALSPVLKRPGREVDHSPISSADTRMMELYLHSPSCLRVVVII
jgi:hypothetical protein